MLSRTRTARTVAVLLWAVAVVGMLPAASMVAVAVARVPEIALERLALPVSASLRNSIKKCLDSILMTGNNNGRRYITWGAIISVLMVVIGYLLQSGIGHVLSRLAALEAADVELAKSRQPNINKLYIIEERQNKSLAEQETQTKRLEVLENRVRNLEARR